MKTADSAARFDRSRSRDSGRRRGFSLVELMVAITVLSVIMIFIAGITGTVSDTWSNSERRLESYQSARGVLELMTRELTPAVVDTRMQFAVFKAETLERAGAKNVVGNAPAIIWMAPIGEQGGLRCVGYFLTRDSARDFYRLKRIYIPPYDPLDPDKPNNYFPRFSSKGNPRDTSLRVSPLNAVWFLRNWDATAFDDDDPFNRDVVVSTVADGVIAFWIQCFDILGNPIPWVSESSVHPQIAATPMIYNSAAYFQAATTVPFSTATGETFLYLNDTTMRGNRVPAAVDITIVTIDSRTLVRGVNLDPVLDQYEQGKLDIMDASGNGTLDLDASVQAFNDLLLANGIFETRTFTTRVKLVNGS